jgi:formyltetrahydrofolate deformylase
MADKPSTAILLICCPDCQGLVASVTRFIHAHRGNILDLDQHVDSREGTFFMRVVWDLSGFGLTPEAFGPIFAQDIANPKQMTWSLHTTLLRQRMAIFVSSQSHCLHDMLARVDSGEWNVDLPLLISNHEVLESIAVRHSIPFHHVEITSDNKPQQEAHELQLLKDNDIDFVVLARYMQVLSPTFVEQYAHRIINIHHSFLPAFAGAKPYHSAFKRGVKVIGATSHYVTADLDAGPIIDQEVVRVSHRDSIADLLRKGRDLEKIVLARAIWHHLERNILVYDNRTVVFD